LAVSVTDVDKGSTQGNTNFSVGKVTFDSSYPTNGEALVPADCRLTRIDYMIIAPSAGYVFEYVVSTNKVKAYWSGTAGAVMAEVTNATDLSAVSAYFIAFGK